MTGSSEPGLLRGQVWDIVQDIPGPQAWTVSHSLLSSLEPLPCLSASEVGPGVPASPEDIEGRVRGLPMGLVSSQLGS